MAGEEEYVRFWPDSADRIRRGELETEPDDSGRDRSDPAVDLSVWLEDG